MLIAYSYRCAFCGVQLNLTDAAHIVPVSHGADVDKTYNGLALCALHHRAYDQSLVTVWEDYTVRISETEEMRLRAIPRGRYGGFSRGAFAFDTPPACRL